MSFSYSRTAVLNQPDDGILHMIGHECRRCLLHDLVPLGAELALPPHKAAPPPNKLDALPTYAKNDEYNPHSVVEV